MDPITSRLERLALENQIKACGDAIEEQEEVIHNLRFIHDYVGKFGLDEASLAILNENGQLSELLNIPEDELGSTGVTIVQEGLLDKIKDKVKEKIAAYKKKIELDCDNNHRALERLEASLSKAIETFSETSPESYSDKPLSGYPAKYIEHQLQLIIRMFGILAGGGLEKEIDKFVYIDLLHIKADIVGLFDGMIDDYKDYDFFELPSEKCRIQYCYGWNEWEDIDDWEKSIEDRRKRRGFKMGTTYKNLGWTSNNIKHLLDLSEQGIKQGFHSIIYKRHIADLITKLHNARDAKIKDLDKNNPTIKQALTLTEPLGIIKSEFDAAKSTLLRASKLFDDLCNELHRYVGIIRDRVLQKPNDEKDNF